jgi:hypothetical protein
MAMRRLVALQILLVGLIAPASGAVKPMPPPELVKARTAFAAAVSKGDEAAAAALTSFPLKNTAYKAPPKLMRKAFAALFADYRAMAACIKTSPLAPDHGAWLIDCDGNILRFGLRGGRWLHTAYENINE